MGTLLPCSVDFEIITSPLSSLITTPDPDLYSLGSKAGLKFIRIKGSMGGIHFEMAYFLVIHSTHHVFLHMPFEPF
ncbi:hypothetical protein E1A91_D10G233500v1 [Gossypium mustelinum]|uniref:Uncharacterized protein n=1 Tax=Gossypium mustelinum TaxID=34275 RepID=A0A5D2TAC4_GOSMU|nr:hypothetical protein E1A91_D10G233500v1 [Gossypium mustelinum]TYI62279.1 hypothetical protein E1A91_D10G233500v1 [Gossypium mustelinum]TYI62280.1 hypothetical protein E1A91_D10G233500v1 [Gossypium mustelinum]